jgi:hypothetical protein
VGSQNSLVIAGSWIAIPPVLFSQLMNILEMSEMSAGLVAMGVVWFALAVTRGRLVYMTDVMLTETDGMTLEEEAASKRVRRRVRLTQGVFIGGILTAATLAIFLLP